MKKLLIAAFIGGSLTVPAVPSIAHEGMHFETRGECESYLAKMRNDQRKMSKRHNMDWDKDQHWGWYCHEHNGGYIIMSHWG